MPKIFNRQLEDKRIRRMNEDRWFMLHQKTLLWLANTSEGRDFLCIDKSFPVIHEIAKNYIKHHDFIPEGKKFRRRTTSEFRVGAKYANIIRYRWEAWLNYQADYNVALFLRTLPRQYVPEYALAENRVTGIAQLTTTFFPDPDPETTSVDGSARRSVATETFTNLRTGAGTTFQDATAGDTLVQLSSSTTTDEYDLLVRAFFLFDTSSLTDSATITSATLSLFGAFGPVDDQLGGTQKVAINTTTPASDTALASTDYGNTATIRQNSTDITLASYNTADYNDFALNSTGITNISKTGITKFGAKISSDIDNAAPTWTGDQNARCQCRFADQAGTTNDPKLVVVDNSDAAGAVFVSTLLLMGVG